MQLLKVIVMNALEHLGRKPGRKRANLKVAKEPLFMPQIISCSKNTF